MAQGVFFNIAEDILKNLGSKALEEIAAAWGFKARLNRLKETIESIKDVILDAQEIQVGSHRAMGLLQRLQDVVYDADDLFDEFATLASKNEAIEGNKLIKQVRIFFSRSNPIALASTISQKIKSIREDLDAILKDGRLPGLVPLPSQQPNLQLVPRPSTYQTHSFVDAEEVIGRDEDKTTLLDMLLSSSGTEECPSVVAIVGMAGLGKTTLAQLLCNDELVKQHFELRLWVCVSDNFDVEDIIKKILMSATDDESPKLQLDQLQSRLRQKVSRRKYLLVLDDVWNEDRVKWLQLSVLLKSDIEGSKILVTTRSRDVAKAMGTVRTHDLGFLSDEKSWALFQKMAFQPGQGDNSPQLVEAGKEIVKKCGNVPLAIRTIGSLLYGMDESKWLSFKDSESLAKISDNRNNIMPILEFSYNHLTSPLKNCFAYCALFPKDFEFQKDTLISLWMAEGFLIPTDGSRGNLEEAGEDFFFTLVQRCFFQDIRVNKWGNIERCKIHDLLHDLAQKVAGDESYMAKLGETNLKKRIRHLSLGYRLSSTQSIPSCVLDLKRLRTFLLPEQVYDWSVFTKSVCHKLISSFRCLRVLHLNNLGVKILPSSIGKLMHLRYLSLSRTRVKTLPSSITDLQNLQTLDLSFCDNLISLPKDIRKLTNLRSLDLDRCSSLSHMPPGMAELTSLHKLNQFVVNNEYPSDSRSASAQLIDLKNLNSLKGNLEIILVGEVKDPAFEAKEANLSSKHGLIGLGITKSIEDDREPSDRVIKHDEAILDGLKPPQNLKLLEIAGYEGGKLPSWAMMDHLSNCLPYLVEVNLIDLPKWQQLPPFGHLKFLKDLHLEGLTSVEFMDSTPFSHNVPSFFPSLEELTLKKMHGLKGWWKDGEEGVLDDGTDEVVVVEAEDGQQAYPPFHNLTSLTIDGCPNLKSFPGCPNVKRLKLARVDETLSVLKITGRASSGSSIELRELDTDDVQDLISVPKESVQHLSTLRVQDRKMDSTWILQRFLTSLPSLRQLEFYKCHSLKCGTAGLEHLTALEKLTFKDCRELDLSASGHQGAEDEDEDEDGMPWKALHHNLRSLDFSALHKLQALPHGLQYQGAEDEDEDEDEDGMPWKALHHNLRSLNLSALYKLQALPHGLQYLTNLRSLEISFHEHLMELPEWIGCLSFLEYFRLVCCERLTSLPEGFRQLTRLNELNIIGCFGLTERCRGPTGEDWPKIQHIPLLIVVSVPD